MTILIGFCGYSFHTSRYYTYDKTKFNGYLFRLQTEGICEAIVNGKTMKIKKGDILLVKPGDYYELRVEPNQNSGDYHLLGEGEWIDQWWKRSVKPTISRINLDEKLLALWRHIIVEKRRPASEENPELTEYLLKALCINIERAVRETAPTVSRPYSVTQMMRYIEEHATNTIKVEDVAEFAGLSVSRAVHLFKSTIGKTIIEYAQEIRLSTAINQMKYTAMTLEHIAENCGFGTYTYFYKVFKKKYGIAPGAYREKE
ncbi:AraC family transcriptional regulator [Litchfieldia salsa]|uniref:Transcriptional regulator, AraC family n=1 Tax=Litchfieldia salsa TaxID=930152 RepID=A0A1H0WXJ2_9BACI|nr:AraC family transcriptional regulator [Litchfieldia salsa]SDP95309.1 transcriptional regulator, AraC family [Litchfieldia salsa]